MWGGFAAAVAIEIAVLFVPAAIALGALRVRGALAVACAPCVTVVVATVLSIAYASFGVPCSWISFTVPLVVTALVIVVAAAVVSLARGGQRRDRRERAGRSGSGRGGVAGAVVRVTEAFRDRRSVRFAFALVVGVAVGTLVFLRALDGADSFIQEYDNMHHLGQLRAYLETGNWSPFSGSMYPTPEDAAFDPQPSAGGFYPSVWHLFSALAASAIGVPLTVAANATTFVFAFVVFPLSMWAFFEAAFPGKPAVIVLGSLATLAFGAFPYGFITFGPLFPNLTSFAMIPAVAAALMGAFGDGASRGRRAGCAALLVIGFGALAFAQPNGVFSLGVLMMFYLASRCGRIARGSALRRLSAAEGEGAADGARAGRRAWMKGVVAFLVVVAIVWTALFNAPFLHAVVTHDWAPACGTFQAIANAALLSFGAYPPSVLLFALIVVGVVYTLYRREYAWITCSYAFMAFSYIVCASREGLLKHFLSGFWYTDSFRLAATLAIIAVPLAAIGLYCATRGVRAALAALAARFETGAGAPRFSIAVVAAAFLVLAFFPTLTFAQAGRVDTQTASATSQMAAFFGTDVPHAYDAEERAFAADVESLVGEDAVIINQPNDGSAFAYAVDGLNVVYRYLRDYDTPGETADSRIVRESLDEIAADDEVAAAVDRMGAEYLVQFDAGDVGCTQPYLFTYEPQQWTGINAVNESTPGFELVLARGDMRLYRITA